MEGRKVFVERDVVVDETVVNLSLSYGKDGELLYLIGSGKPKYLAGLYKRRWSIEVFFQALKKGVQYGEVLPAMPVKIQKALWYRISGLHDMLGYGNTGREEPSCKA